MCNAINTCFTTNGRTPEGSRVYRTKQKSFKEVPPNLLRLAAILDFIDIHENDAV